MSALRAFLRQGLALGFALVAFADFAAAQEDRTGGMAVSTVSSARRCFRDIIPVSGFLEPRNEVQIRADREGMLISDVAVQPGDMVNADQVLAKLANAQTLQDEAQVMTPIAGLVLDVGAVAGAYASPSAPDPLFRILANNELELKADVLPADAGKLKPGQGVTLLSPDGGTLAGSVRVLDGAVDGMTQLGVARIAVPVSPKLRAGAFLRADIDAGETCGISVPLSAILYGSGGPIVEVVRSGRVEIRSVKIGVIAGPDVELKSGLRDSETVIARAGGFLREGDPVRAVAPLASTAR